MASPCMQLEIVSCRDDFLLWNHLWQDEAACPERFHTNRLPTVERLLVARPRQARAFRLRADAPTVTMQRLKALVAGSLPTFLDVRDNFGSPAITEDNWVRQLEGNGGPGAILVGDDTWADLFPPGSPGVAQAFPYPSFEVSDLDTVDLGVREHLGRLLGIDLVNLTSPASPPADSPSDSRPSLPVPATEKPSWDVLVGHMLGVDHVGHTHGPGHPEMARKLDELEAILERLAAWLLRVPPEQERILLLVAGDHGMTPDGNHGGASNHETHAGLFALSNDLLFPDVGRGLAASGTGIATVDQIDLVPTLSLLLGLPIPFGSLGAVIPEFFGGGGGASSRGESPELAAAALWINALQVQRFQHAYGATVGWPVPARPADDGTAGAVASTRQCSFVTQEMEFQSQTGQESEPHTESPLERRLLGSASLAEQLAILECVFVRAQQTQTAAASSFSASGGAAASLAPSPSAATASIRASRLYLRLVLGFFRQQWTQFSLPRMSAGILLALGGASGLFILLLRHAGLTPWVPKALLQLFPFAAGPRPPSRLQMAPASSSTAAPVALEFGPMHMQLGKELQRPLRPPPATPSARTAAAVSPTSITGAWAAAPAIPGLPQPLSGFAGSEDPAVKPCATPPILASVFVPPVETEPAVAVEGPRQRHRWQPLPAAAFGDAEAPGLIGSASGNPSQGSWTHANGIAALARQGLQLLVNSVPFLAMPSASAIAGLARPPVLGLSLSILAAAVDAAGGVSDNMIKAERGLSSVYLLFGIAGCLLHRVARRPRSPAESPGFGDNLGRRHPVCWIRSVPGPGVDPRNPFLPRALAQEPRRRPPPPPRPPLPPSPPPWWEALALWVAIEATPFIFSAGTSAMAAPQLAAGVAGPPLVPSVSPTSSFADLGLLGCLLTAAGVAGLLQWLARSRRQRLQRSLHTAAGIACLAFWAIPAAIDGSDGGERVSFLRTGLARLVLAGCTIVSIALSLAAAVSSGAAADGGVPGRRARASPARSLAGAARPLSLLLWPVCLLVGPTGPWLVLCAGLLCFRHMLPLTRGSGPPGGERRTRPAASDTVAAGIGLALLALKLFFVLGQDQTLSALNISAAYIGFPEFSFWRSGLMLVVNTYGLVGLVAVAAPHVVAGALGPASAQAAHAHGDGDRPTETSWAAAASFCLVFAGRALLSMINCWVNRRHLMVWAVFAPKLLYDSAALVVVAASLGASLLLPAALRFGHGLQRHASKMEARPALLKAD